MTIVRQATVQDAAQIAEIYAPVVLATVTSFELEPPDSDEMARRIDTVTAGYPWLVSEESGTVLGYAYATAFRQRPAYRWSVETTVYVGAGHRGRGVGRHLYKTLLELSSAWGFANAYAGIALPNPASESLHRSVGFTPIGVFPRAGHKFGGWHDVAWWHRPLIDDAGKTNPPPPPSSPSTERVREILSLI